MRFTILCDGEPIGEAELDPGGGFTSAEFDPLPAFERVRPALDAATRALNESARRLAAAHETPSQPHPAPPPEAAMPAGGATQGSMTAHAIDSELSRRLGLDALYAEGEPARRLRFALRDAAGAAPTPRFVSVRTLPSRHGSGVTRPFVTAHF